MPTLNQYSIVVGRNATYNELASAKFLAANISTATGYQPEIRFDDTPAKDFELVIGKTSREKSENVVFERAEGREYEYELRFVGNKLFLTGYGIPIEKEARPFSAYAMFNFGGIGTDLATFRFIETTFGGGMLFPADLSMTVDLDAAEIEIDERYNFVFTAEKLASERPSLFDGAALYSVPSAVSLNTATNALIFKSADGSLTVYDGGSAADAEHLCDVLEYLNDGKYEKPRVNAWLVSIASAASAGALKAVSEKAELAERLDIAKVCFSLADESFYSVCAANAPENADVRSALRMIGERLGCETICLYTGDTLKLGDFEIDVLYAPDETIANIEKPHIFDTTVIFKAKTEKKSVLLFGSSKNTAAVKIVEQSPEALECDIMVVSQNGNGGISRRCYELAKAKNYLYQTTMAKYFGDNGEGFAASADSITRARNIISECGVRYEDIYADIYGMLSIPLEV